MGFFDELLDFNEALVEDEMDYDYFKEHYLENDNSNNYDYDFGDFDFGDNDFDSFE